ncbi:MAG: serine/threonine protein kinase [Planctomycetes bacterium]|nr:serine/threonine protein kinase [Planctomycetota bacterium]MCB9902849.1 serine/threonine protein kinase [Planctomycetota bacterium]
MQRDDDVRDPYAELPGERAGDAIDRYTLVDRLGEGGMGTVWLAEQSEPVKRRVAFKIIKLGMDTREVVVRFEAERQALALMDHPCIAKVLDGGATSNGRPYFVMELVDGVPITRYCDEHRLDVKDRLTLFMRVCDAVQHAHHKGVIHRDIKPSNVLVANGDDGPAPKVIDFGIAKATSAELTQKTMYTELGQIIGTPEYMAPEQAGTTDVDVDTRADVYSLGVLLYELMTGTTPFDSRTALASGYAELLRQIREVDPAVPSTRISSLGDRATPIAASRSVEVDALRRRLRGDLDWVVMKALEKDRARRYETPSALAEDIAHFLAREPVEAAPPSAVYRARKFVQRRKKTVAAVATIAVVLVAGVIGTGFGLLRAIDEKERADEEARRATQLAEAEAGMRVKAQQNEQLAVEAAARAEAAAAQEAKARKRAEDITGFVVAALQSADAVSAGKEDMTILEAMDNAIADIDSGRFAEDPEAEGSMKNVVGHILKNNGRAGDAERLLREALEAAREISDGDSEQLTSALTNLGNVLRELGRLQEAEPLFVEALAMRRRIDAGDSVGLVTILNHLATTWYGLGRFEESEPMFVETLAMARRLKAEYPRDLAITLLNFANVKMALHKDLEAEAMLVEALELQRELVQRDDVFTALLIDTLASARSRLGNLEEAHEMCVESLDMYRRMYSGDNALVAVAIANLATSFKGLGDYARAEELYTESLEMLQRLYPEGHVDVARAHFLIGGLHFDVGIDPVPDFEAALELYRALDPGDNATYAACMKGLGVQYRLRRRPMEAEPLLAAALDIHRRIYPPTHPELLDSLNSYGVNCWQQGRLDLSIPLFEELLATSIEANGREHALTRQVLLNLAINYRDAGRAEEAVAHAIEAFDAYVPEPQWPVIGGTVLDICLQAGDADAAISIAKRLVDLARERMPDGGPQFLAVVRHNGSVLLRLGAFADAEPALRSAQEITVAENPDSFASIELSADLGRAILGQGRHAEAKPLLIDVHTALSARRSVPRSLRGTFLETLEGLLAVAEAESDTTAAANWREELEARRAEWAK